MGKSIAATVATTLGGALLAIAPTAYADGGEHHVYRTDGDGVWLHDVPAVHDGLVTVLANGTEFTPQCYTLAEEVLGNPVWLYGTAGSTTGYVTDYYIDTHWSTVSDLEAQGIVACGTPSATAEPAPPTEADESAGPVNIQLNVDGDRERSLLAMSDQLQAAADAAGVSGQELARIIYHEGGNYLSGDAWRITPVQNAEMNLPVIDSVGLGQVTVDTARDGSMTVYGEDTSQYSDGVIKSWLIYDQDYARKMAAGKLRMSQDAGLGAGWPQFMAYSLSTEKAVAWKAAGHPMDAASLSSLRIDVSAFQERQQHYNDAVNAIG